MCYGIWQLVALVHSNVASQAGYGVATTMLGRLVSGGAPGAREREENVLPSLDMKIVFLLSKFKKKIDKVRKNIASPLA